MFGIVEEQEGLETLARINEAYVDSEGRPFKDIRFVLTLQFMIFFFFMKLHSNLEGHSFQTMNIRDFS